MIHYLISHLERSTLNLNIRVGEWFSHQSAKLKREIFNEGSNPSTDSNFKFKNMAYIYCITNLINSDNKSAQSHIIGCCKNKTKSQYGYIWKYLPEPI